MGTFGSLMCDIWKGNGLKPNRRKGMMEGGQGRVWFKRVMKGRVWGKRRNKVRVPAFWIKVGHWNNPRSGL